MLQTITRVHSVIGIGHPELCLFHGSFKNLASRVSTLSETISASSVALHFYLLILFRSMHVSGYYAVVVVSFRTRKKNFAIETACEM